MKRLLIILFAFSVVSATGQSLKKFRNMAGAQAKFRVNAMVDQSNVSADTLDAHNLRLLVVEDSTYAYALDIVTGTVTADSINVSTDLVMGSAELTEAELEILDGATLSTDELNTPLDGASVTLTEFQELETIGETSISANQWGMLGGVSENLTSTELDYLDGATGTTGTATTNLVYSASPTITGTAVISAASFADPVTMDSTLMMGTFGDAQQLLSEGSSNTNVLQGVYPMVNFDATGGKVFAGTHNRFLVITTHQTNNTSMFGTESQFRLKSVNLSTGVHAGIWAYAEQSGTSTLSGGGYLAGAAVTVEASTDFTAGATEHVVGVVVDGSVNAGATIHDDTNLSAIYIKSAGMDWKTGIKFEGIDSVEMELVNGALIYNNDSDTLHLEETNVAVTGAFWVNGGSVSDFAITDVQPTLSEYWAKTQELNRLPAFENKDRRNVNVYISGLEESNERLLRYVVEMEARLSELEGKLNE